MNISKSPPDQKLALTFPFGINENPTPDIGEASAGYNFDVVANQSSLVPRKPFDLKGTAPNAAAITGIMQLVKRDATQTTLVCAGNQVYQWNGSTTWTSKATITSGALFRDTYWSLGDYLVISDVSLTNVVQTWDGTTFGALTTGLGTALYAKYSIVHNGRVWLFNVTTNTATPHLMVASAFENPQNYSTTQRAVTGSFSTGLEAFYMLTPDLKPINGVVTFQDVLIVSTTGGKLFVLSGTDAKTYAWTDFFDGSPAIGNESLASIGNDVVFMRQGGHINLLSATQTFGNARTDELTRWIPNTIKNLAGSLIVYDITNQKVLFFIANKVLVLFKDIISRDRYQLRDGKSPWGVYTTSDSCSFNTQSAKFMYDPGTTNYYVFFGDSTGRMMRMEGTGAGDAGTSTVPVSWKSRHLNSEFIKPWPFVSEIMTGRIQYRRLASINVTIGVSWDDEYSTQNSTFTLKGPTVGDIAQYFNGGSYYNDGNYYNQGFSFAGRESSINFSPSGKGPGCYISFYTETNQQFQVDQIEIE